ncbi:bifunctional hydroxymethylpyrimidine kinase/phosphomethylpyrimidine kinase [Paenibacillus sp. SAF-054]|uniref:bifunctional hydroxymethylpyrimidine kinase/phosphomethylpyrimidine kinase n=1 Tax=unclassified Paenibacillus TaxID=185978 RepID=UPI003F7F7BD6
MSTVKALTVAGSDSSGGAGIQADIKTFQELGVFGMSAITAVTVQNTLGVQALYPLPADAVAEQMRAVHTDLGIDAIKTGMLLSADIIEAAADQIRAFGSKNVVVDPVMVAKGGAELLRQDAVSALKRRLLPLAMVVTPNIPEAEVLAGMQILTMEDRREAALKISEYGAGVVVIKGGHDPATDDAVDLMYDGQSFTLLSCPRITTKHTHGTGCTFSAAITAGLAKGMPVAMAVRTAREYIQAAIEDTLAIGGGCGPTNHWAYNRRRQGALR